MRLRGIGTPWYYITRGYINNVVYNRYIYITIYLYIYIPIAYRLNMFLALTTRVRVAVRPAARRQGQRPPRLDIVPEVSKSL